MPKGRRSTVMSVFFLAESRFGLYPTYRNGGCRFDLQVGDWDSGTSPVECYGSVNQVTTFRGLDSDSDDREPMTDLISISTDSAATRFLAS